MVRKKIEFTMIQDKSRLRSTRNKRLVGLLKKEMKLNRLTAMPFASFYFVDDQLVRIASSDPDAMIQRIITHMESGKSVQTLTPDDLEKLTNNELKIGVRRGNRGPYFGEEGKSSQAHMTPEEQMIAAQAAANMRAAAAAEGGMHGGGGGIDGGGGGVGSHFQRVVRRRGISDASTSGSSNRGDEADVMSDNDDADVDEDTKHVIKPDMDALLASLNNGGGGGAAGGGGMLSAAAAPPGTSASMPLALAASNLLSGLATSMGANSSGRLLMNDDDRKNSVLAQALLRQTGASGPPLGHGMPGASVLPPPSSSTSSPGSGGSAGGFNSMNYHLHQHMMLDSAGGGGVGGSGAANTSSSSSSSNSRKRPRTETDEYSDAMGQIEDRMSKEGMMIKEDPNAAHRPRHQIDGVPTLPPTLDISSLIQHLNSGGGVGSFDPSTSAGGSALSRLLANAQNSSGAAPASGSASPLPPNSKFTQLASQLLSGAPSHFSMPPMQQHHHHHHQQPQQRQLTAAGHGPQPPGGGGGSGGSAMSSAAAARLFQFPHAQMPPAMPPGPGSGSASPSIHPPSSPSLGGGGGNNTDPNFASKLREASSFLVSDNIVPPSGPPPPPGTSSSSGGSGPHHFHSSSSSSSSSTSSSSNPSATSARSQAAHDQNLESMMSVLK